MANPLHLELVKHGAAAIRSWRQTNAHQRLDLRGAYLCGSKLSDADLGFAYLIETDHGDYGVEVDLRRAKLRNANLSRADLELVDLREGDLLEPT